MQLSKRLTALADLVTTGNRLADVGTDHGYVPISLIEQKRIPSAIAMDINKGPLERAREHIRQYGYEAYIETRLSDGLYALKAGEADAVLIAGMGGDLIRRILEDGAEVLPSVKELILQPQSEIQKVRRWLVEHGWTIVCENIVLDEGKYYPMFRAVHGEEKRNYSLADYRFGHLELQQSMDTLKEFLEKQRETQRQILASLPKTGDERILQRRKLVQEEIELLRAEQLACVLTQCKQEMDRRSK